MARTKRQNLAAIQPPSAQLPPPEASVEDELQEDDENVEVRMQKIIFLIPPLPGGGNCPGSLANSPDEMKHARLHKQERQEQEQRHQHQQQQQQQQRLALLRKSVMLRKKKPIKLLVGLLDPVKASFVKRKLDRIGGLSPWLKSQGLGQFDRIFQEHKLNEEELLSLTMQALKDIGIVPVGPRRKLIWAIDQLCNG